MPEFEAALTTQGKYISPILLLAAECSLCTAVEVAQGGMSQKGGDRPYKGHLGNDRSPRQRLPWLAVPRPAHARLA
jgi:hypothetical protein